LSQLVGAIQVGLRNLVFAEIPLPQSVIAAMGKLDELLLEMSTYSESWEEYKKAIQSGESFVELKKSLRIVGGESSELSIDF